MIESVYDGEGSSGTSYNVEGDGVLARGELANIDWLEVAEGPRVSVERGDARPFM